MVEGRDSNSLYILKPQFYSVIDLLQTICEMFDFNVLLLIRS